MTVPFKEDQFISIYIPFDPCKFSWDIPFKFSNPGSKFMLLYTVPCVGSVEERARFKEERKCKPFQWFLDNIYPEKFILDSPEQVYAYGRLKNPTTATCLDNLQSDDKVTLLNYNKVYEVVRY